ncbi:hypothetical protein [Flavobacterium coralii]|uniref:hypothetical protein n=1 Tax=Flavobacterium coralii TaxID=2838017 RepID=UPI000C368888|nr:hypothetical protein [Flavobacterium sp.]
MTRYETIIELGDKFVKLIGKGFVPVHLLDWKVYYEAYLEEKQVQKSKRQAVLTLMAKYPISEKHLYQIIKFMEN